MSDSDNPRTWVELEETGKPRLKPHASNTVRATGQGLGRVAATLADHDVEGGEVSGTRHLATAVAAAGLAAGATRKAAVAGYAEGKAAAELDAVAARQRTIGFDRAKLERTGTSGQLRADLAMLAQDPRLALTPKWPMHPRRSALAFDHLYAQPGDFVTIDLLRVGVRPTPGVRAALEDYHHGGRDRLVAAGLLPPIRTVELHPDRHGTGHAERGAVALPRVEPQAQPGWAGARRAARGGGMEM